MDSYENWMQKALTLARKGEGLTRPNPPVGSIVVKRGKLVGQGYHQQAGAAHAEIQALKQAGDRARGAILYVTLEPCSTFGRTPPCTDSIIRSGIRQVVVSTHDPNPAHCGNGLKILRKKGINVIENVCSIHGKKLIAPFAKLVLTGRPYLTLKLAMSLDGKIADYRGNSRWITCVSSRKMVQNLRQRVDAVVVGAGTMCMDNPSLLPRPSGGRRPFRVILDAHGRVPATVNVLSDGAQEQTIMVTTGACPALVRKKWVKKGAEVWTLPAVQAGVSLTALLRRLGKKGLLHVLCEGGSELASAFIRAKLVDEYLFFIAPCIIGGKKAVNAVGGIGWPLNSVPELKFTECRFIGNDIMIKAKPLVSIVGTVEKVLKRRFPRSPTAATAEKIRKFGAL